MTATPVVPAPVPAAGRRTIGAALSGRDNALNFVRLVLASAVIVGHTWPLGGYELHEAAHLSSWAVNGFFAISGYLIAGSRFRMRWWPYLWRRALRILPAFWVCLLMTALVFSPLAALWAGKSWEPGSAAGYVFKNLGLYMQQQTIDGTLQSIPYPGQWNGSLWTLAYEFAAYLAAGAVLSVALARRHRVAGMWTLFVCVALLTVVAWTVLDINNPQIMQGLRLGGFFVAGMALWSVADRLPVTWVLAVPSAVAVGVLYLAEPVVQWPLAALPTAYLMLWAGAVVPFRVGSVNDVSYGIYIYAFPVQQLLAVLGVPALLGFWGYAVTAWLVTLPLAVGSWFLVERSAMKWRRLVPAQRMPV